MRTTPHKTESDAGRRVQLLPVVKAHVGTRDVRDGVPYPAGLSQELVDLCAKENARQFSNPGLLPRQEPENLSTGEEQQKGTTKETEEFLSIPPEKSVPTLEISALPTISTNSCTRESSQNLAPAPTGTSSA